MTTYFVTVGSNQYRVDIHNDQFQVNGELLDVKMRRLNEQGLFLLQQGTRQLELVMQPREQNQFSVLVDRRHMTVQVEKKEGPAPKKLPTAGALSAPMPGTIIEIRVSEGQQVSKGDVVAVMESMKMQMEIRSPVAGTIIKIAVKPGNKVEKGAALVQVLE